jgi:hypothetical protein
VMVATDQARQRHAVAAEIRGELMSQVGAIAHESSGRVAGLAAVLATVAVLANATDSRAAAILAVDLNVGSNTQSGSWTDPNQAGSSVSFTGRAIASLTDTTWTFSGLGTTYTASGSITASVDKSLNDRQDRSGNLGVIDDPGTYSNLYRDVAITAPGSVLTFSDLKPGQKYEIYIQAFDAAATRQSTFTAALANLAGPGNTTVMLSSSGATNIDPSGSLTASNASVSFANANALTADANGQVKFTLGGHSGNTRINGFQIAAVVPEPAILSLAGVTVGLMIRRRR